MRKQEKIRSRVPMSMSTLKVSQNLLKKNFRMRIQSGKTRSPFFLFPTVVCFFVFFFVFLDEITDSSFCEYITLKIIILLDEGRDVHTDSTMLWRLLTLINLNIWHKGNSCRLSFFRMTHISGSTVK
jgi:hypothetical protein